MKGVYRRIKNKGLQHGTNFDDWSDPLHHRTKHMTTTRKKLSKYEQKVRLNKFNLRTAQSQTEDESGEIRLLLDQGCPLMSPKEIRHIRLPFHHGLVLNLADEGYFMTCEYIKDLIVLDEMHNKHNTNRTLLRFNKIALGMLAEGLKLAEDARRKGNKAAEVEALLYLGVNFRSLDISFHWLAHELMEQSAEILNDPNNSVDAKVEATARFVYSSFLLEIAHDLEKAKFHLQKSMKLSIGKNFWFLNEEGERCDILYLQSCVILSRINLEEAYEWRDTDLEQAILCCRSSLLWAKQASNKHHTAKALLTLVQLYLADNQLSPIFDLLQEHIKICKSQKFYRELCEGYVMLSRYYETVGDSNKVVEVIDELISFALEHKILDILMKAHIKLAEIYGIRRMGKKMMHHAEAAFKNAKLVGSYDEIEICTCLIGIAQGDQLWDNYVQLMLSIINELDNKSLARLMCWRDLRIQFVPEVITFKYQPEIEKTVNAKKKFELTKKEELDYVRQGKLKTLLSHRSIQSQESLSIHGYRRTTTKTNYYSRKSSMYIRPEQDQSR